MNASPIDVEPDPLNDRALPNLGRRLNEIEQISDISLRIIEYRRLFEAFPGASLAAFNLAVDLWNNGQPSAARDAARRAVAIAPELLYRLPFGLAELLRAERTGDNSFERLGQEVAGFRITHCILENPRTVLYQVERALERGYLRVLRRVLSSDTAIRSRFLASAGLVRRTRDPGLAPILDTGTLPDDCAYVLMQPEPGELLSQRIGRDDLLAPLAPALRTLAGALARLHERGVCYLGLEPERIQTSTGGAAFLQLLDSERAVEGTSPLPPVIADGAVDRRVDPVLFMAPELFGGEVEVGPPADVYALGVLAYFVFCEHPPFQGERQSEVIAAHRNGPTPPLRTVAPNVPEALARLVESMLDKDPARRPPMSRVAEVLARPAPAPAPAPVTPEIAAPSALSAPPVVAPPAPPEMPVAPSPSATPPRTPDPEPTPQVQVPWLPITLGAALVGAIGIVLLAKPSPSPEPPGPLESPMYALAITASGAGSVTGVDCGAACAKAYRSGTVVTLTAVPSGSAVFGGWTGCDQTTGTTCTVTMSTARTVTAAFRGAYTPPAENTVPTRPPEPEVPLVDVTGKVFTTYTTDRAGNVFVPQDLASTPIEVLVLDGAKFTHHPGSSPKPGAFKIGKVPPGQRYVRVGSTYLVTRATEDIDLGSVELGRPDRVSVQNQQSVVSLQLGGLEPVQADDLFQLVSSDIGIFLEWNGVATRTVTAGQRELRANATLSTLIDAAHEDRVYITQLSTRTSPTGEGYWALSRAYAPPPFSTKVGTVTLGPANMTPPPELTRSFRWLRSGFDAGSAVHPAAQLLEDGLYVSAFPLHPTVRPGGATSDLVVARRAGAGADVSFGELTFGNPFPSAWTLWVMHRSIFEVAFRVARAEPIAIRAVALLWAPLVAEGGMQEVRPLVTPVRAPLINDADASVDRSRVGTAPVLSWDAPRIGASASYCVTVFELSAHGGKTEALMVAEFYTTKRSVRLPDDLLVRGKQYVALITAVVAPGDPSIRPRKRGRPYGSADVLTGMFSPS